jgi:serine/threonine-protein kinase
LPVAGRDPADVPPKSRKTLYTLLTLLMLAALLGLGGYALFGRTPAVRTVPVTSVVALDEATAKGRLKADGFATAVVRRTSDKDKGEVILQDPKASVPRPLGSTVTITVSSGLGQTSVPDVTGLTVAAARTRITGVGLTVEKPVQVNDPTVGKGKVIETSPKANARVDVGSAVTLRVASGKVKVPSVVGLSRSDAQTALTTAGLRYRTRFAFNPNEGTVLSQTHRGATVDVGTQIVLTVAQRPAPTVAPPPPAPKPTVSPTTPPTTGLPTTGPTAATTAP